MRAHVSATLSRGRDLVAIWVDVPCHVDPTDYATVMRKSAKASLMRCVRVEPIAWSGPNAQTYTSLAWAKVITTSSECMLISGSIFRIIHYTRGESKEQKAATFDVLTTLKKRPANLLRYISTSCGPSAL